MVALPSRLCRLITSAELPIILLVSPALLFPTPGRLVVCAFLPVIWFCARRTTGHALPPTPLDWPIALIVLMALASLAVSFDPLFSLGKVCGVVLGAAVFFACVRRLRTADDVWAGAGMFSLAGAALALIGLLGTAWIEKFAVLESVVARLPRAIRGIPGAEEGFHPNAVAGSLLLFAPVQAALVGATLRAQLPEWLRSARAVVLGGQLTALVLTVLTLVLTQSRGGWFGFFVGGWAAAVWSGRRTRLLAAVTFAGVAVTVVLIGPSAAFQMVISQSGPRIASNVSGRLVLWRTAIEAIGDFPVTGMGMNVFRRVAPVLYPSPLVEMHVDVVHAHNQLLQTAVDLGIPGLTGYVSLLLVASWLLTDAYRRGSGWRRQLASGLLAGLIAHLTFGISDAIPLGAKVGVVFWMYLALVVGVFRSCARQTPSVSPAATASS